MRSSRLPVAILASVLFLSACAPLAASPEPQPLPSPADPWTMTLTQSGGFIGVMLKVEVSSDGQLKAEDHRSGRSVTKTLPPETIARLAALRSALFTVAPHTPTPTCADCFLYDLQVTGSGRSMQIRADDTTLAKSGAAELIGALQELRDIALRSQP